MKLVDDIILLILRLLWSAYELMVRNLGLHVALDGGLPLLIEQMSDSIAIAVCLLVVDWIGLDYFSQLTSIRIIRREKYKFERTNSNNL